MSELKICDIDDLKNVDSMIRADYLRTRHKWLKKVREEEKSQFKKEGIRICNFKRKEKNKEWRLKNREEYNERCNKYYHENKEKILNQQRKWRLKNKEKVNTCYRERWKKYYAKNKDRINANQRMRRAQRKEKAKQDFLLKVDVLPPI